MIFYWFTATKLTNHYETNKHLPSFFRFIHIYHTIINPFLSYSCDTQRKCSPKIQALRLLKLD